MKALVCGLITLFALFLAGCGGGGGNTNTTGTLIMTVASPETAGSPGLIAAVYSSPNGSNPQGVEVSFTTSNPSVVKIQTAKATVGSNGRAESPFFVVAGPTDTTAVIYASTGGLTSFRTLSIPGNPDAPIPQTPVAAKAVSIEFKTAIPAKIALMGMGGAGSTVTSDVSFIVKDANNVGLSGVVVDFSLDTTIGGITLSPASATSNAQGLVQTKVFSGIMPTTVSVKATVKALKPGDPVISTVSDGLVIQSGLADQDSLSISMSDFNVEGLNFDGKTINVTARLADHFNNPAFDGTAIYFTTEGGVITPSCTTVAGACTVTWTSQNPRPQGTLLPDGSVVGAGRVTILAYAVGEESFTDLNGNGVADVGEFVDTPEAFRDDDEDGVRGANEPFIDFNSNGTYNGPDGVFNGVLRPAGVTGPTSKHIFSNSVITMSSSLADITLTQAGSAATTIEPDKAYIVTVKDTNGNMMPSGTVITITAPAFGTYNGLKTLTVPKSTSTSGSSITFKIASAVPLTAESGLLTVSVTTPGGLTTILDIPVSGSF